MRLIDVTARIDTNNPIYTNLTRIAIDMLKRTGGRSFVIAGGAVRDLWLQRDSVRDVDVFLLDPETTFVTTGLEREVGNTPPSATHCIATFKDPFAPIQVCCPDTDGEWTTIITAHELCSRFDWHECMAVFFPNGQVYVGDTLASHWGRWSNPGNLTLNREVATKCLKPHEIAYTMLRGHRFTERYGWAITEADFNFLSALHLRRSRPWKALLTRFFQ